LPNFIPISIVRCQPKTKPKGQCLLLLTLLKSLALLKALKALALLKSKLKCPKAPKSWMRLRRLRSLGCRVG
jgi:hypothetical protein